MVRKKGGATTNQQRERENREKGITADHMNAGAGGKKALERPLPSLGEKTGRGGVLGRRRDRKEKTSG